MRTRFGASLGVDLHNLLEHLVFDALLEIDIVVELSHLIFDGLYDVFVLGTFLFKFFLIELL